jgi:hypothetical protein
LIIYREIGGLEIQLTVLVETCETPLPFEPFGDKKITGIGLLFENLLMFRVQTTEMALREFWIKNGLWKCTPKLMGFQVNPVQNCLNWRILKQSIFGMKPHNFIKWRWRGGFEGVFEIGPVSGRPSFTSRHD